MGLSRLECTSFRTLRAWHIPFGYSWPRTCWRRACVLLWLCIQIEKWVLSVSAALELTTLTTTSLLANWRCSCSRKIILLYACFMIFQYQLWNYAIPLKSMHARSTRISLVVNSIVMPKKQFEESYKSYMKMQQNVSCLLTTSHSIWIYRANKRSVILLSCVRHGKCSRKLWNFGGEAWILRPKPQNGWSLAKTK